MIDRLAGHLSEPVKQNLVLETLRGAPGPLLSNEIATITGLRNCNLQPKLLRLIKKGLIERWPVLIAGRHQIYRGKGIPMTIVPGGAMRRQFLYQIVRQDDE